MPDQPPITPKRVSLVIASICLCIATSCSRSNPPAGAESANRLSRDKDRNVLETETFRGAEVSAKEIVFKVADCETENRNARLETVKAFARETTKDDQLIVSQIGNGCWYVATSSRLTVNELFDQLYSKIAINIAANPNSLQAPQVTNVEPNFIIRLQPQPGDQPVEGSPSDDYFQKGQLWGLSNQQRPGIDIDALRAWQLSKGSDKIVVGVIDTGVYYPHPDLQANVWRAPRDFKIRLGTEEISCPADTRGFNVVGMTAQERCDPLDEIGHGTHVSGIIGAVGDNHLGVVGVNWTTKILGLRFMRSGAGTAADAARAIDFAVELKKVLGADANIRVLNISWGYRKEHFSAYDTQMLGERIAVAGKEQILVVASAGEDGGNDNDLVEHYPSGYDLPNLVSVTAVDREGLLADRSNFGQKSVDLSAPGSEIYSTYTMNPDSYYRSGGTSMAAPFVSGAAALILSVPRCSGLSPAQLKDAIIRGVRPTRLPTITATGGMLNVYRSIEQCR